MTEITEPAKQMAADLANAETGLDEPYGVGCFSVSIANGVEIALARLCARTIDAKIARHELDNERDALLARMQADMAEIDRIATGAAWRNDPATSFTGGIATIAARWRVEADPLLIEARELVASMEHPSFCERAAGIRAGEHDGAAALGIALAAIKRGIALGAAK